MASLMDLNDRIFRELDRLEEAGKDDLADEVERAKAICSLSNTAVANANTILRASQMRAQASENLAGSVVVPKGLLDGKD